jgi:hypothetical protein
LFFLTLLLTGAGNALTGEVALDRLRLLETENAKYHYTTVTSAQKSRTTARHGSTNGTPTVRCAK